MLTHQFLQLGRVVLSSPRFFHATLLTAFVFLCQPVLGQQSGAPVMFSPVKLAPISSEIQLTGSITSPKRAELSVATAGLVQGIQVDDGSRVSAGDILLSLDAELASLSARRAKADVERLNLELADARRRLDEASSLRKVRSIAESAIKSLEAEVAAKRAASASANADLAYQKALLVRHTLKAPFSGVISSKLVEVGEWVSPGDAVLGLVALSPLRVDFALPEAYVGQIEPGTTLRVQSNAFSEASYSAKVAVVVPVGQAGSRTFLLRAVLDDAVGQPLLKPGMSVRAWLLQPQGREGLLVPRDAVLRQPDGRSIVWVEKRGENGLVVEERRVSLGVSAAGEVEVRSGLSEGDRVVIKGNEALQPGQAVYESGK